MPNTAPEVAEQTEQKTSPVVTFRHRSISASVFENASDRDKSYLSVSIQKRYKDQESGDWKNSSSFLRDELPVLEHLVRQAFAYILEQDSSRPAKSE